MDGLLPVIAGKGNGFAVGQVAEDGRVIVFPIVRLRLAVRR